MSYNSLNPPPTPPVSTIYPDVAVGKASVGTAHFVGSWPTMEYPLVITESQEISLLNEFYNYFKIVTDDNIVLKISPVPTGSIFVVEYSGVGSVEILVNQNSSSPFSSLSFIGGTYIVVKFSDSVKISKLDNPTVL